ncbi:MAG: hypothetical protein MZU97_12460 [Bacillus subtilis]|nr:hypothetical protein [Bacillus subtilis]
MSTLLLHRARTAALALAAIFPGLVLAPRLRSGDLRLRGGDPEAGGAGPVVYNGQRM